jgi:NNP family nitrate/nitrite transporter-like MFS transporter
MSIVDNVTPAQQSRALWLSTIAFTTCFAVWTIFSIIGLQIQKDLGLSETEFGLLVGTPILSGSLIRLILGIWSDQYGGRIVYTIVMITAAIATFLLTTVDTYFMYLVAALGIGYCRWLVCRRYCLHFEVVSNRKARHCAGYFRSGQCRRGSH